MAAQDRIVRRSRIILCVLGPLSLGLLGALSALVFIDLLKSKEIPKLQTPAILAATFNVSSLVLALVLVGLCLCSRGSGWLQSVVLPLAGFLFAVAGACLSLTTFIIQKSNKTKLSSQVPFPAEVAVWIFSAAVQLGFYAIIIFGRYTSDGRSSILSFSTGEPKRPVPERPPTPPTPLRIIAPPYALPQARANPSVTTDSRRSSWRNSLQSLQQAVRPSTSRQKLLGPRSSMSRSSSQSGVSDARSVATTAPSDGFDNWDTSNLDQQIKETVQLAVPTKGTALEPIPGSRPVSPARALDGPFPAATSQPSLHSLQSQERLQERPPTSLSVLSALSQLQRPPTAFSIASGRSATPTMNNPNMLEAHIHPLFRTDSPVPPPTVTANTVVTASPYSGHVIRAPSRASSRTRLNDRSSSPVIRSRAGSVDDLPSRSRSSSTTRAMTPPIPDFILSANREKVF